MQTESEFNKSLKESLELFEHHKTICWFERLNTGKVKTQWGSWLQLCRDFTPDWIIIFYDKNKHLFVLWVEGKSDSGMNVVKEGQTEFSEHFNKQKGFKVIRTNSVEEVKNFINENSFDKMQGWSKEVDQFMFPETISEEDFEE